MKSASLLRSANRAVLISTAAIAMSGRAHGLQHGHGEPAEAPAVEASQLPADSHAGHVGHEPGEPGQELAPDHGSVARHGAEPSGMTGHGSNGALGYYPMSREASGTAWQPDASTHAGLHLQSGRWTFMGHALVNGVYDWQEGPRGGEKAFVSGMVMGSARRGLSDGVLQFRAGFSPDPLMGKRGYPLHLATGETADGATALVDRQHPHDVFMELSASYSHRLSDEASLFVYAGLPGEPAFGPPAFMHRLSIMDSPEAPITHHWLDSTHIVFGVLTAGLVHGNVKLEASRFHGREPDQHRWNIESGSLDSTAARLSWNPRPELALQASWAHVKSPEQLEPGENQTKWSASAIYTKQLGPGSWWSSTLAWGRRSSGHEGLEAHLLESALGLGDWTIFGRAERTENNELVSEQGHHGPTYTVGKLSLGAVRDFRIAPHVRFGLGGLFAFNIVPKPLEAFYEGDPKGAMAFMRLRLD